MLKYLNILEPIRNTSNNMRDHYVYRHRRLDTNEVFYIGKGSVYQSVKSRKSYKKRYSRAFSRGSRNIWWNNIVNKANYSVEIVSKNLTEEEAFELEVFLIGLYGRKDLELGTLVNITDGGEGTSGHKLTKERTEAIIKRNSGENNRWYKCVPEEHPMFGRVKELNPFFGKSHSEESLSKMKGPREKMKGENHPKTSIILNTQTGIFYFSILEASESCSITYSSLRRYLNEKNNNKTDFKKI